MARADVSHTIADLDKASAGILTDREWSGLQRSALNDLLKNVAMRIDGWPHYGVGHIDDDGRLELAPLGTVGLNVCQHLAETLTGKAVH